jgi:hypothetical protein
MSRRRTRGAFVLAGALSLALPAGSGRAQSASAQPPSGSPAQPSAQTPQQAKAALTEQAKAALKEMSTTLATARTLRFKVRNLVPMKAPDGDWMTIVGAANVLRGGPDKLCVETGGDLFPFKLIYDGKTVVAFAPAEKIYAQKEAPGTIDQMLEQAAKNGETAFIFGDLVSKDPYAAMTKGLRSARVVGTSVIDGVETRHVAVHGQQLDWEIWIGTKDRLPRLVTLTDIGEARKPTQTVQLSDWALDQAVPPDTFAFKAPADAMQVPFRSPEQRREARRGPPAAGRK